MPSIVLVQSLRIEQIYVCDCCMCDSDSDLICTFGNRLRDIISGVEISQILRASLIHTLCAHDAGDIIVLP